MGMLVGLYPKAEEKADMSEGLSSRETKTPSRVPFINSRAPREPA
jgi:hypothetical protein